MKVTVGHQTPGFSELQLPQSEDGQKAFVSFFPFALHPPSSPSPHSSSSTFTESNRPRRRRRSSVSPRISLLAGGLKIPAKPSRHSAPLLFFHHRQRRLPSPRADDTCRHQAQHMYICICSRLFTAAYGENWLQDGRRNRTLLSVFTVFYHLCATSMLNYLQSDCDIVGHSCADIHTHWEQQLFGFSSVVKLVR